MNSLPFWRAFWLIFGFALLHHPVFANEPQWIWKGPQPERNQSVFFRKTFELPEKPQRAHLWAAADVMIVYVNGEKLVLQRGWENLFYRDIAPLLEKGENLIAVEGFNGGDNEAGLLLQVSAFVNGATAAIVSDQSWKIRASVPTNWKSTDYDDARWERATAFGTLGQGNRAKIDRESMLVAAGIKKLPAATIPTEIAPKPEPKTEPKPRPAAVSEAKPPIAPNSLRTQPIEPIEPKLAKKSEKSPLPRTSEPYRGSHPFGNEAMPANAIRVAEGFQVERLYSVPKTTQGSWVSLCIDDAGRLIASDETGGLYRMSVPKSGQTLKPAGIEKIDLKIGNAQGLLFAFDSLYVVVNSPETAENAPACGLYRLRDTDGDDNFDLAEKLREFQRAGGEHGPHSVVLGPDGASLYVCVGNQTPPVDWHRTRIREVWGEDLLLQPPAGKKFGDADAKAPGGWIAKTDPEGKKWEIIATGLRNDFDAAFSREGELFAFDSDMEWDLGTPWYRPTRVCHVVSGAEFGWRAQGGKWPSHYLDSVPPVLEIGTGAPTGVTFGHGAKFPLKFQEALFACDWSHGRLYAVHLEANGASYRATAEEFLSAQPLPLTDILIHPDGALYFTSGGRQTPSGLYRVTYVGGESTDPPAQGQLAADLPRSFQIREALEQFHGHAIPGTADTVWPYLTDPDRHVRYAARTALEHQPAETWQKKALREVHPRGKIEALTALARVGDANLQTSILDSLDGLFWEHLDEPARLDVTRAHAILLARTGAPIPPMRDRLVRIWMERFPSDSAALNAEILELLVFLQAEQVAEPALLLLDRATSQEEQISYAKSLCHLKAGWSKVSRTRFLDWFLKAESFRGGESLPHYLAHMRKAAVSQINEAEKDEFSALLNDDPVNRMVFAGAARRTFVKSWTVRDFDRDLSQGLRRAHLENGRRLFSEANCQACHRFGAEGRAIGPDLTDLTQKFGARDILSHILNPSGQISSRYGSVVISKRGRAGVVIGQIIDHDGDDLIVNTDLRDPMQLERVNRADVESIQPSPVSMMPPGLLNSFDKAEVLDLLGFLVSGAGNEAEVAQK